MIIKKILKKNISLKDTYKDKDCYIFGNGSSIKKYDLSKFSNKIIFSCGWLFLHKDYKCLNILADFEMHPGIFFPIWKNEYNKRFEFNRINYIFKKRERILKTKYFFTSLVNLPGLIRYKNVYYLYHFGKKKFDHNYISPLSEFSLMENSLFAMIGIASYMGFKNINLVGMDYLLNTPVSGHFYEKNEIITTNSENVKKRNEYFFNFYSKVANFKLVVSSKDETSFLDTTEYKTLIGENNKNYTNKDIIDKSDLELLDKTNVKYNIF